VEWTHIWKGFGALAGAYVFAALASRGLRLEGRHVRRQERLGPLGVDAVDKGVESGGER
jgi:hypothetical protein